MAKPFHNANPISFLNGIFFIEFSPKIIANNPFCATANKDNPYDHQGGDVLVSMIHGYDSKTGVSLQLQPQSVNFGRPPYFGANRYRTTAMAA